MSYPPELELIDQLIGGSLPLAVVYRFFTDDEYAKKVLAAYISKDVIVFSDEDGELPKWKTAEILRDHQPLNGYEKLQVSITAKGAKSFEEGSWS